MLFGTYIGKVVNSSDPRGLGRLQVRVVHVYGPVGDQMVADEDLPWAVPLGMPAGESHKTGGISWLPHVGANVAVRFFDGEPEKPSWEFCQQGLDQKDAFTAHTYDAPQNDKPAPPQERGALTRYGHVTEFRPNKVTTMTSQGHGLILSNAPDPEKDAGPEPAPTSGPYRGDLSVFGMVPDGNGGVKHDPNDITDAGVPGFSASKGAWGASIKDTSLMGFAVTPAQLREAGIPQKDWPRTMVKVTVPSTGKTIVAPVVDKLGKGGRVDATYAAYAALGGPMNRNGGTVQAVWEFFPPGRVGESVGNNDPESVGQAMDAHTAGPAAEPATVRAEAKPTGVKTEGGPAPTSSASNEGKGRASLVTRRGNRIDIFDDKDYIQLVGLKSIFCYAPDHWINASGDITVEVGTRDAASGQTTGSLKTYYGTQGKVLDQADQKGGTWSIAIARRGKIDAREIFEIVAGQQAGISTQELDLEADKTAVINVGDTFAVRGARTGTSKASAGYNGGNGSGTGEESYSKQYFTYAETTAIFAKQSFVLYGDACAAKLDVQEYHLFTRKTVLVEADDNINQVTKKNFGVLADENVTVSAKKDVTAVAEQNMSLTATEAMAAKSKTLTVEVAENGTVSAMNLEVTTKEATRLKTVTLEVDATTEARITCAGRTLTISGAGFFFA